jgi:hypothetical protein
MMIRPWRQLQEREQTQTISRTTCSSSVTIFLVTRSSYKEAFDSLHKGFLTKLNLIYVAIKRHSMSSKKWSKEYASEVRIISLLQASGVRIISRLRHKNVVWLL